MKKLIITILISFGFFMVGCMDDMGVVEPLDQTYQTTSVKPYKVSEHWLCLPNSRLAKEMNGAIFSQTESIDGKKGGEIKIDISYTTNFGNIVRIYSKIKIPDQSFEGTSDVRLELHSDFTRLVIESDQPLLKEVEYEQKIDGVDLSGLKKTDIDFILEDISGNVTISNSENIDINIRDNSLELKKIRLKTPGKLGVLVNQPLWAGLPLSGQIDPEDGLFSETKVINGEEGGEIKIEGKYDTPDGRRVEYQARLKFPKGSFQGCKEISHTIFTQFADAQFAPHVDRFDIPAEYDIEVKGLDLSGVDPDSYNFVYQAPDGTYEAVEFDEMEIDIRNGKMKVKKARLPHFSRFGFVN